MITGESVLSLAGSDRQVLGTTVTLTVLPCDNNDDDDDDEERISTTASVDGGPLPTVSRPTRLALTGRDRNGVQSPSESLETPSRSSHSLANTHTHTRLTALLPGLPG